MDPLINDEHCKQISAAIQQSGQDWEIAAATPTLWKTLPPRTGLYMFVWRPALTFKLARDSEGVCPPYILYIGQAGGGVSKNTIKTRYKGEYSKYVGADPAILWDSANADKDTVREHRLRKYLTLTPLEYWWCAIDSSEQIIRLESRLNYLLSPPLNRVGRARLVATDAFPQPTSRSHNA